MRNSTLKCEFNYVIKAFDCFPIKIVESFDRAPLEATKAFDIFIKLESRHLLKMFVHDIAP